MLNMVMGCGGHVLLDRNKAIKFCKHLDVVSKEQTTAKPSKQL